MAFCVCKGWHPFTLDNTLVPCYTCYLRFRNTPYLRTQFELDWNELDLDFTRVKRVEHIFQDKTPKLAADDPRLTVGACGDPREESVHLRSFGDTENIHETKLNYKSVYELTITSVSVDPSRIVSELDRVVNSVQSSVVNYHACIELTQAGMPHIHAILYSSLKYINQSKLKRFIQDRYSCKLVRDEKKFLAYIHKEKGNHIVEAYCTRHNVPQFISHPCNHPLQSV